MAEKPNTHILYSRTIASLLGMFAIILVGTGVYFGPMSRVEAIEQPEPNPQPTIKYDSIDKKPDRQLDSTDRVASVNTAYAEIGKAYRAAVDVTLFTWNMFYLRCVAIFTAAGYLAFKSTPRHIWFAVGLLVISALMTVFITKPQMHNNQRVIQKTLASGFLLEIRNEGLGYRFVHEVHSAGLNEEAPNSIRMWERQRTRLIKEYSKKKQNSDEYVHAWVEPKEWKYFGIYPNLTHFAVIYSVVHLLFAIGLGLPSIIAKYNRTSHSTA